MNEKMYSEIKQYAIIYFRDSTNNPIDAVILGLETFLKKNDLKIVKTSAEEPREALVTPDEQK